MAKRRPKTDQRDNDEDSFASSSSSSSSDDEFLTLKEGGQKEDREALIRKKLMENFYGKTTTSSATGTNDEDGNDDVSANGESTGNDIHSRSIHDGNDEMKGTSPAKRGDASASTAAPSSDDLDSPYFDPDAHTSQHVLYSNMHTLLETEERLALQVRTLDSTMQTLVYENYSKFIDATDAIRSIGVSVHANESGLATLTSGISQIAASSQAVETALGNLRERVADKIRIKRLLTRLDSLLKLPSTLNQYILQDQYRLATKHFLSAHAILSKHSAGFESLKTIQTDCHAIMIQMIHTIQHKLVHWSGQILLFPQQGQDRDHGNENDENIFQQSDGDDDDDSHDDENNIDFKNAHSNEVAQSKITPTVDMEPPEPPQTIHDIFECAGTLLIVMPSDSEEIANKDPDERPVQKREQPTFDAGITAIECKSMALASTIRHLERILENHQLELQDAIFGTTFLTDDAASNDGNAPIFGAGVKLGTPTTTSVEGPNGDELPKGSHFIPTLYLHDMLEAVTLYGIGLANTTNPGSLSMGETPATPAAASISDQDKLLLMDFITEAYSAFLSHVKGVLLDHSLSGNEDDEDDDDGANHEAYADDDEGDMVDTSSAVSSVGRSGDMIQITATSDDAAYSEVSGAMTHLLRSVRDLAAGLSLPHAGIDASFASGLIDQAVEVTETMVRRRVAQKFFSLRVRVVQDCLSPFCHDAMALTHSDPGDKENNDQSQQQPRVMELVQMANIALSDGLQLVDDTVKSILTGGVVISDLKGVDFAMVKEAVQGCCRRFVVWFASCLEVLAGLEASTTTIDAPPPVDELASTEQENDDMDEAVLMGLSPTAASGIPANTSMVAASKVDELSQMSREEDVISEKVENSLSELLAELDKAPEAHRLEFMLAITEMCRLAQRSIMENIIQSINFNNRGGYGARKQNKKNTGIFQSSSSAKRSKLDEEDAKAADRFMVAASRVIALYATNRGSKAARQYCSNLFEVSQRGGQDDENMIPTAPREEAWKILEIAKLTCIDCANVFGGERLAGPVPEPPRDEADFLHAGGSVGMMGSRSSLAGSNLSAIKGLQLDVERMFTAKVSTFPHPLQAADFTRNAIVTVTLQVAFHAILEKVRTCTFTGSGYRQVQVDVALLRHFLSHYVKDDFLGEGTHSKTALDNVLSNVQKHAGDRCKDLRCVGESKFYDPSRESSVSIQSIVRSFMRNSVETDLFSRFIIEEESDSNGR